MKASLALVHAAFFLSVAAALVFENLWFRQAGLAFGNSVWASSLVLASFMAGLALGNAVAARWGASLRRPLVSYALLECAVAAAGMSLVLLLPRLNQPLAPLLGALAERPVMRDATRLAVTFSLLVVPTTAMGMTLPVLAHALRAWRPQFGRNLGSLYGWNTLGAVAGTLAVEFFLVASLGIRGSGAFASLLGGLAALAALLASAKPRAEPPATVASRGTSLVGSAPVARLLAAAALAGAVLLALEVVWFRFVAQFTANTQMNLALMLAAVLAGIGLGGLLASAWLRFRPDADEHLRGLALLAGFALVASYSACDGLLPRLARDGGLSTVDTALLSATLMGPVSLASGLLFTLTGTALFRHVGSDAASAGTLTLANTLGGTAGALLGGFVLLPGLGVERSFALLAVGYGVAAVCLPGGVVLPARRLGSLAAGLWLLSLALFPFGLMERRFLRASLGPLDGPGTRVLAAREGLTETAVYLERRLRDERLDVRLVTNGYSMSGTAHRAQRYMRLYVYLPLAVHPQVRSALLISYGVGTTADALAKSRELERIDVVDISRDLLELSRLAYPEERRFPLDDPRFRVHIEDGRHFLQTRERRFDLITAEPPRPRTRGSSTSTPKSTSGSSAHAWPKVASPATGCPSTRSASPRRARSAAASATRFPTARSGMEPISIGCCSARARRRGRSPSSASRGNGPTRSWRTNSSSWASIDPSCSERCSSPMPMACAVSSARRGLSRTTGPVASTPPPGSIGSPIEA